MRKGVIGLAVLFSILIFPAYATTPPKAGSVCSKQGISKTYQGKKFTCIKSGKKLVWNKGVIVKPKVTNPSPQVNPTPITSNESQVSISKIADLQQGFKKIPIIIWEDSERKIRGSQSKYLTQNIYIGPNTPLSKRFNLESFFNLGSKYFEGYSQPDGFNAIYYSYDDIAWATDKVNQLYPGAPFLSALSKGPTRWCPSKSNCGGAGASMPLANFGHAFFAMDPQAESVSYLTRGGLEVHEFAHMVQYAQFKGKKTMSASNSGVGLLPFWFTEGHAHLAGNAATAKSLEEYKSNRAFWLKVSSGNGFGEIKKFSQGEIQEFFNKLQLGQSDQTFAPYVYSIGYLAVEAMAAVRGIDHVMNLIVDVSEGMSFEEAFNQRFGISWNEGSVILASVIEAIYKDYLTK